MHESAAYVVTDEHGALRVGAKRVALESVLAAWGQGHSPETIRSQYPALTLEEIYGAIAWSLANRDEVESYLKRQEALWDQWQQRSQSQRDALRQRQERQERREPRERQQGREKKPF